MDTLAMKRIEHLNRVYGEFCRKCAKCGKPFACFAYSLKSDGKIIRGYYHKKCFDIVKRQVKP